MKSKKFSFTIDGIQDFFFRHVEKLFFGLACGLILLFVWFGLKTPRFDTTTPKQMLANADKADTYIHDDSHWNKLQEFRVADTEAAKRIQDAKPIDPNTYQIRHLAGTAVLTREPRRDPALVPVQEFEVRHIRAQVAKKGKGSGEAKLGLSGIPDHPYLSFPQDQRLEMFQYRPDKLDKNNTELRTIDAVVGMALIDHEQQLINYKENFQYQRGYDSLRDVPEYAFIEVQRKTDDTDWMPITKKVYEMTSFLADPAKELGDEDYVLPSLALPIPPFLGVDYRPFSLHPKIPTKNVFAEDDQQRSKQGGDEGSDDSLTGDDPWGDDRDSSEEGDKKPETESEDMDEAEKVAPLRLVRFYDLDPNKEVGKTYHYRVRVWMKDPNNPNAVNADIANQMSEKSKKGGKLGLGGGMGGGSEADSGGGAGDSKDNKNRSAAKNKKPLSEFDLSGDVRSRLKSGDDEVPADIDDEELKGLYALARPSEWVEATQPVTINSGFETFVAGPVDAPPVIQVGGGEFGASEPSINIVANSFQDDLGVFVPAQTETLKGSLLNFESVTNVLDPLTWTIKELFEDEDNRGGKTGRFFKTDAVVLDIMGGERQPFSRGKDVFYAPGECLIMDRNFRFHLHSDIDDQTAWRHANFTSNANLDAMEEAGGRKKDDDKDNDRGRGGGDGF